MNTTARLPQAREATQRELARGLLANATHEEIAAVLAREGITSRRLTVLAHSSPATVLRMFEEVAS